MKLAGSIGRIFFFLYLVLSMPSDVFAQSPTATPYPDFLLDHNQDGTIDAKDLLIFLHRWGVQGITPPTPSPTETPTNANSFDVNLDFSPPFPLRMIRIPAGSFMMGSPDTERSRNSGEGPVHQVTLANDFFMGQTEVTQAQWETVMGFLPDLEFGRGDNYPIYSVSWIECQDFLTALNTLSGEGNFRLPTEAEWEYACRAGGIKRFYFGNSLGCLDAPECEDCLADTAVITPAKWLPGFAIDLPSGFEPNLPLPNLLFRSDFMWYCANSGSLAKPVRSLRANRFGLFDMSGNVSEWVQDEFRSNYTGAPTDGSAWVGGGGSGRVHRGGAFVFPAGHCRSARRSFGDPSSRSPSVGFRIVWTP